MTQVPTPARQPRHLPLLAVRDVEPPDPGGEPAQLLAATVILGRTIAALTLLF
jgi:hypothetical protein